jgi:eukaryotic-like serine/threonine-protein kinase
VLLSSSTARALDAGTGAELWQFVPDTVAMARSAADERAYYIGTASHRVYALDAATGHPFWSSELARHGMDPTVVDVVVHGDTLYASLVESVSPTGHLKRGIIVALDRYTGRELWRYVNERAGESHDAGRHTVAGRMLLVNDLNGGAIIGVDRFTGQEVWRYTGRADRYGAWDIFSVADGVAYVASNDTYVYALDPESGRIHWKTQLKGSANSSAVCGDYVFAAAGSLHKLRRSDGKEVASLFLDRNGSVGNEWVRSRLLAHGNRVYFVGNRAVYAVSCE